MPLPRCASVLAGFLGVTAVTHDTDIGGSAANFPVTQCSLIRDAGSPDPIVRRHAQETLIAAYWKPVYKYIRIKWRCDNEAAKDLTQAFFALALEKAFFDRFDPAKARFRTFIRLCVDAFVGKENRAAGRVKRGGAIDILSIDFDAAEGELRHLEPAAALDPDEFFRQEWLRALFATAVDELRRQCAAADKNTHFKLFERYDLKGPNADMSPSYAGLAAEFGLAETQVTNYLAYARRHFRQLVLERLRAATGSEDEFQQEMWQLFGRDVR
jgi:RNA polymerase sigma factor (sigma-70 family)